MLPIVERVLNSFKKGIDAEKEKMWLKRFITLLTPEHKKEATAVEDPDNPDPEALLGDLSEVDVEKKLKEEMHRLTSPGSVKKWNQSFKDLIKPHLNDPENLDKASSMFFSALNKKLKTHYDEATVVNYLEELMTYVEKHLDVFLKAVHGTGKIDLDPSGFFFIRSDDENKDTFTRPGATFKCEVLHMKQPFFYTIKIMGPGIKEGEYLINVSKSHLDLDPGSIYKLEVTSKKEDEREEGEEDKKSRIRVLLHGGVERQQHHLKINSSQVFELLSKAFDRFAKEVIIPGHAAEKGFSRGDSEKVKKLKKELKEKEDRFEKTKDKNKKERLLAVINDLKDKLDQEHRGGPGESKKEIHRLMNLPKEHSLHEDIGKYSPAELPREKSLGEVFERGESPVDDIAQGLFYLGAKGAPGSSETDSTLMEDVPVTHPPEEDYERASKKLGLALEKLKGDYKGIPMATLGKMVMTATFRAFDPAESGGGTADTWQTLLFQEMEDYAGRHPKDVRKLDAVHDPNRVKGLVTDALLENANYEKGRKNFSRALKHLLFKEKREKEDKKKKEARVNLEKFYHGHKPDFATLPSEIQYVLKTLENLWLDPVANRSKMTTEYKKMEGLISTPRLPKKVKQEIIEKEAAPAVTEEQVEKIIEKMPKDVVKELKGMLKKDVKPSLEAIKLLHKHTGPIKGNEVKPVLDFLKYGPKKKDEYEGLTKKEIFEKKQKEFKEDPLSEAEKKRQEIKPLWLREKEPPGEKEKFEVVKTPEYSKESLTPKEFKFFVEENTVDYFKNFMIENDDDKSFKDAIDIIDAIEEAGVSKRFVGQLKKQLLLYGIKALDVSKDLAKIVERFDMYSKNTPSSDEQNPELRSEIYDSFENDLKGMAEELNIKYPKKKGPKGAPVKTKEHNRAVEKFQAIVQKDPKLMLDIEELIRMETNR